MVKSLIYVFTWKAEGQREKHSSYNMNIYRIELIN